MHFLLECLAYLFGRGTVKLCQSFKYVKKLAKNGTKRFNVETKFLADFYDIFCGKNWTIIILTFL